jgi:hypothetical protein
MAQCIVKAQCKLALQLLKDSLEELQLNLSSLGFEKTVESGNSEMVMSPLKDSSISIFRVEYTRALSNLSGAANGVVEAWRLVPRSVTSARTNSGVFAKKERKKPMLQVISPPFTPSEHYVYAANLPPFTPSSLSASAIPSNDEANRGPHKRKCSLPQRAITPPKNWSDRSLQRIVTLDFYSSYQQNPAKLLSQTTALASANGQVSMASNKTITKSQASTDTDSDDVETAASVNTPQSLIQKHLIKTSPSNSEKSAKRPLSALKPLPALLMEKQPHLLDLSSYQITKGASPVVWKGAQPMAIHNEMVDFECLTPEEVKTCSTLRILPSQYLDIKRVMITASKHCGSFKKREAQTWFKLDVNKICILFDWFKSLGWINP